MSECPPLGICIPVTYNYCRDGDTPVFTLRTGQNIAVRMINVWAPEMKDQGGPQAKEMLHATLSKAAEIRLFIPLAKAGEDGIVDVTDLLKAMTFDRVPANVWADGVLVQ